MIKEIEFTFIYQLLDSENELNKTDYELVLAARNAAKIAYAPYSGFFVGAAALLSNEQVITGSNQENASYPSGMCAERSLLATAAQLYPNMPIITMAVTYFNSKGKSITPSSPCGFCRQVITEFENRVQHTIRLILCGSSGKVIIVPKSSLLLPLGFSTNDLF